MRKILKPLLVIIQLAITSTVLAKGPEAISVISLATQNSLEKLVKKVKQDFNENQALITKVADLNESVSTLFSKLDLEFTNGMIEDGLFVQSLKGAQQAIENAAKNSSADSIGRIVIDLTEDYNAKINASAPTSVSTTVTTIKVKILIRTNGQDVAGYDIQCNYKWDFNAKNARFKSNQPTNNALINLSPGYYVFYVLKNNAVVRTRDIQVGRDQLNDPIIINL